MDRPFANYLAQQLETVYRESPWYGFGLLASLNKLTEDQWQQPLGHRTVADLVGHLIAWREFAVARLRDSMAYGIEMHSSTDWPDCSGRTSASLLRELEESQIKLKKTLERLSNDDLDEHFPTDYKYSKGDIAAGVIQHDVYHLGQINLLVALLNNNIPPD